MTQISDVKAVTIQSAIPTADGEGLVLVLTQRGVPAHIMLKWSEIGIGLQAVNRGVEKLNTHRKKLGKSDLFKGERVNAQLVGSFQVSEIKSPDHHVKLLTLQSVAGLRCDFAIPMDTKDIRGRPMHKAIAEELSSDQGAERKRPN